MATVATSTVFYDLVSEDLSRTIRFEIPYFYDLDTGDVLTPPTENVEYDLAHATVIGFVTEDHRRQERVEKVRTEHVQFFLDLLAWCADISTVDAEIMDLIRRDAA